MIKLYKIPLYLLQRPLYPPDLASSDYCLSTNLKKILDSNEEVITETNASTNRFSRGVSICPYVREAPKWLYRFWRRLLWSVKADWIQKVVFASPSLDQKLINRCNICILNGAFHFKFVVEDWESPLWTSDISTLPIEQNFQDHAYKSKVLKVLLATNQKNKT